MIQSTFDLYPDLTPVQKVLYRLAAPRLRKHLYFRHCSFKILSAESCPTIGDDQLALWHHSRGSSAKIRLLFFFEDGQLCFRVSLHNGLPTSLGFVYRVDLEPELDEDGLNRCFDLAYKTMTEQVQKLTRKKKRRSLKKRL